MSNKRKPAKAQVTKPVAGLFTVAVCGEFSTGKSSILNLLARQPVIPVSLEYSGLPPVRLVWGGDRTIYAVTGNRRRKLDSIADFQGANGAVPDMIEIQVPDPELSGLEIIEVPLPPGEDFEDSAMPLMKEADLVVWCTSANQALKLSELMGMENIPKPVLDRSILAATRADLLKMDDRAKVMRRLTSEAGGSFARILFIAASRKICASATDPEVWRQSGGPELLDAIRAEAGLTGSDEPARDETGKGLVREAAAEEAVEVAQALADEAAPEPATDEAEPAAAEADADEVAAGAAPEAPADEPADEPAPEATEAAPEAPAEAPAQEVAPEAVEEDAEEVPVEAAAEDDAEAVPEAPAEEPAGEAEPAATEEDAEATVEVAAEAAPEAPADEPADEPAPEATEADTDEVPVEAAAEDDAEAVPEAPAEEPAGEAEPAATEEDAEMAVEVAAEAAPEAPADEPAEAPADEVATAPADEPAPEATEAAPEAPAEEPAEAPAAEEPVAEPVAKPAAKEVAAAPLEPVAAKPARKAQGEGMMREPDLSPLWGLGGFIGACLVDSESGIMLGSVGGGSLDMETAAAVNTEVVRAKGKAMQALGLDDHIDEIAISLGTQYHLIRPLASNRQVFLYVALDRGDANLGLARMSVKTLESTLDLS